MKNATTVSRKSARGKAKGQSKKTTRRAARHDVWAKDALHNIRVAAGKITVDVAAVKFALARLVLNDDSKPRAVDLVQAFADLNEASILAARITDRLLNQVEAYTGLAEVAS